MNLRLIPMLLGVATLLSNGVVAQDSTSVTSNSSSSPSTATPSDTSSPPSATSTPTPWSVSPSSTSPPVMTCESAGLVSLYVLGAPSAFCVPANTCNTNYIGACPGANAVDIKGTALPRGSCCATLEGTGEVGCVSLELLAGDVQCIQHPGSEISAEVIDPTTLTPTPTPTTTSPLPTYPLPTSTPSDETTDGPEATWSSPVATTTTPSPEATTTTPSPSTTAPLEVPTVITSSLSTSSAGSGADEVNEREPEVGDESTPAPTRSTSTPSVLVPDLSSLEPITEVPRTSAQSNSVVESSANSNSNTESNSESNGSGSATSRSGGPFAILNSNVLLAVVVGSIATVAIIVGAFILGRHGGSSVTSSSTTSTSVFSRKYHGSDAAPLTLDGDDDMYEDLRFQANEAFSPIHVQPGHSYAASTTPGHDRPSYFL